MQNTTLPAIDVRWLIDPARASTPELIPAAQRPQRLDYPIPSEIGHGHLYRLGLGEGSSLFRGVHRFRAGLDSRLVPLAEFDFRFPGITLAMQTIQGGMVRHQEIEPRAELLYRPGYDIFRRAERFRVTAWVDTSSNSEMTALILSEARLTELLDAELAERLIDRLRLDPAPMARVWPIPLAVSAPLRAALPDALQGPLQQLFAQAKVLEYLCALTAHVARPATGRRQPTRARDRARALHEYLMHLEGKLPSLDVLAARFGLSARRLNEAFTREYGQPIYAFISDWRLNEAHQAIRDSSVPLKQLAARLGYAHVNHFNNAFKRRFGYPPGSLRRNRRLDDQLSEG